VGQRILVLYEKHGSRYYDAGTDEALRAAALAVLRDRLDPLQGYILEPDPVSSEVGDEAHWRRLVREYRTEKAAYDKAARAVREGDGRLALEVLRSRDGYEYEGFDLAYLEEVPS
jgi:hypothetical protein